MVYEAVGGDVVQPGASPESGVTPEVGHVTPPEGTIAQAAGEVVCGSTYGDLPSLEEVRNTRYHFPTALSFERWLYEGILPQQPPDRLLKD